MNKYRLIASDLDGTLLNNRAQVSRENLDAIYELSQKGGYFVPATGRTYSEIPEALKNNLDIRYIIHSNGAAVFDKTTGERILLTIPNRLGKKIMDVLGNYKVHVMVRCGGESYVDSAMQTERDFDYYNVCEAHRVVVRDFAVYLDDFNTFAYGADNVEVFSAFFHSYDEKIACKKYIEENFKELRVVAVSEYNLEIVSADAGKGNALRRLADLLGVDYSETISIGDSDNDSSITKAAGLGLAVSNACDALKQVADEIICSNEEHVVRYVLSKYFR